MDGGDEDHRRIAALVGVGTATRQLAAALVATEVPVDTLAELRLTIEAVTREVLAEQRPFPRPSRLDAVLGARIFGPVYGEGSPIAPPVRLSWTDDEVVGRCTLGAIYEGPRGYCHGGVSALLLDEVTAKVPQLRSVTRVTRELTVRYLRPVPLMRPLVLGARLVSDDDRESVVRGWIATDADQDRTLVLAEARFVRLGPAQLARFGADGTAATGLTDDGPGLPNTH